MVRVRVVYEQGRLRLHGTSELISRQLSHGMAVRLLYTTIRSDRPSPVRRRLVDTLHSAGLVIGSMRHR